MEVGDADDSARERFARFGSQIPPGRLDPPAVLCPVSTPEAHHRAAADPFLEQPGRALRVGDPHCAGPVEQAAWCAVRRDALDVVLTTIAASAWADSLVLRGSALFAAWLGEAAREPGDLNFVVRPTDWQLQDLRTRQLLDQLAAAVGRGTGPGGLRFLPGQAAGGEGGTGRGPGHRLVLPWAADGGFAGSVQLDLAFSERLP
ncbi:nucleotidyl transferase AbiEii/AbiGii toxin family protein [Streptacidiphilus sp. EB129]|uniref:nucleotidyl transferase AbiEii/AbiGii toxin family protein n=1 Tax=Streptacidiphilus sp. EB129 TaxID=3156262 RepID=UPI0035161F83